MPIEHDKLPVAGCRLPFSLHAVAACVLLCASASAFASAEDEAELALAFGDKEFISLATGSKQLVSRAPAVATVITAQDIAATGARNIDEALQAVPGMHVSVGYLYDPVYAVRGLHTKYNPEVLMLFNGVPITSPYFSNRGDGWNTIPAENIARIEVIRGPGSALYGADAFTGVINVITKTSADVGGTVVGSRLGSYNSREAWVQHGGHWGNVEVAAYLQAGKTDGPNETITADAQTALDKAFSTSASRAPGPLRRADETLNAALDLSYGAWRWRTQYSQRLNAQLAQGVADALDTQGHFNTQRLLTDLNYTNAQFIKDWELSAQASYYERRAPATVVVFPPGTTFPWGAYPDGMIGTPGKDERTTRLNASGVYTGWVGHRLRSGLGMEKTEIYNIQESKNFNFTYVPGVGNLPMPLGSMVDFSNTAPFMKATSRDNLYGFVQDEWAFQPDWTLTLGLRHDRYSDFGSTTNPRAALVWAAQYNLTAKLMYGRAFRAPAFVEMYAINNPAVLGNPNLKPETTDTWEAAVAWQPSGSTQLGVNVYQFQMNDVLRFVPNSDATTGSTAQNTGQQRGHGLELEASWNASSAVRLSGNYSYQRLTDVQTGQEAGLAPHHKIYLRGDWRLGGDWSLNGQWNRIADRSREASDTRAPTPNYETCDLTLTKGTAQSKWTVTGGVRNLFDNDAREPSPKPGNIPNDLPLPRRTWVVQASWRL
ncbi:MAG: TonB-dependent receptor [Burkholderiales bacterium]|nr:TonB-dependent receptor [Burkholderiales bacterium]